LLGSDQALLRHAASLLASVLYLQQLSLSWRHKQEAGLFAPSPTNLISGCQSVKKKRKLDGGPRRNNFLYGYVVLFTFIETGMSLQLN